MAWWNIEYKPKEIKQLTDDELYYKVEMRDLFKDGASEWLVLEECVTLSKAIEIINDNAWSGPRTIAMDLTDQYWTNSEYRLTPLTDLNYQTIKEHYAR